MNGSSGGGSAVKCLVLYDRVNTFCEMLTCFWVIRATQVFCFSLDMKEKLSSIHYMLCTWFSSYLLLRIKY